MTPWATTDETFYPVNLEYLLSHEGTLSVEDVYRLFYVNRIPVSWIQHAYLFAHQFFRHHLMTETEVQRIEDLRRQGIQRHGIPGPIPDWDGWYVATPHDRYRISHLIANDNIELEVLQEYVPVGGEYVLDRPIRNELGPTTEQVGSTTSNVESSSTAPVGPNTDAVCRYTSIPPPRCLTCSAPSEPTCSIASCDCSRRATRPHGCVLCPSLV